MVLGDTAQIVVIATTEAKPDTDPGTTSVAQPLQCRVRARLFGNDFTVSPDGFSDKSFLEVATVQWQWSVTPEVSGDDQQLTVEVQGMRLGLAGYEPAGPEFQTVQNIEVVVEETFMERVNNAVTGFVTHPVIALLLGTFLAAGVAALTRYLRKRRGGPGDDATSPPSGGTETGQHPTGSPVI
jgi:hypothetical protein